MNRFTEDLLSIEFLNATVYSLSEILARDATTYRHKLFNAIFSGSQDQGEVYKNYGITLICFCAAMTNTEIDEMIEEWIKDQ